MCSRIHLYRNPPPSPLFAPEQETPTTLKNDETAVVQNELLKHNDLPIFPSRSAPSANPIVHRKKAKDAIINLRVDAGPSSQLSEITSVETLDKLLMNEKISFLQYLERIPDGYLPKKAKLIEEIKAANEKSKILNGGTKNE